MCVKSGQRGYTDRVEGGKKEKACILPGSVQA